MREWEELVRDERDGHKAALTKMYESVKTLKMVVRGQREVEECRRNTELEDSDGQTVSQVLVSLPPSLFFPGTAESVLAAGNKKHKNR